MSIHRWTLTWAHNARLQVLNSDETTSTNADAKKSLEDSNFDLVVTNHQTAGRGRGSNTWSTVPGEALLSSWIFRNETNPPKMPQPVTSALLGLALFEAAKTTWPKIPWALKAPNDLHVVTPEGPCKVAGLLIEVVANTVIVGLGMNTTGAPQALSPYPALSLVNALARASSEATEGDARINETDWRSFLSNWIKGCRERLQEGLAPDLKQSSREALTGALARHPEFIDIKTVEADGSLVFNDGRRVSWTSL